jgi:hypothetical protein
MAIGPTDIDRLVREVLAALDGDAAGPLPDGESKPTSCTQESGDALVVTARVVTLSELNGRLDSIRRLHVDRKAIITPAVRDELSRRKITLDFVTPACDSTGQLRLVAVASGKSIDPEAFFRGLSLDDVEMVRRTFDCAIESVEHLAGEVAKQNTLGLLLTRHVAAGLCLANRKPGVRAVTGADAKSVAAAADAVGANLLLIDPSGGNLFRLRQAVTAFCSGGVRTCPDVLKKELG